MYFLLYISSASLSFSQRELEELLIVSQANNALAGITGLLLYSDGNFVQYIEGKESAVKSLYEKIEQDDRHKSILFMLEGHSEIRYFSRWSMGFARMNREEWRQIYESIARHSEDKHAIKTKEERAIDFIRSFVDQQRIYLPYLPSDFKAESLTGSPSFGS